MNKLFNLCVVGTNFIVPKFIDAAERSGYFRLHSILSRDELTAEQFRKTNSYKDEVVVFSNIEEMLNTDSVDVVYIASPNGVHIEQASACIQAGKSVYVEKPITSNANELASLIALAQDHNVLLIEGMRSLVTPNFKLLTENLFRVGKIRQCTSTFAKVSSRYQDYLAGNNPNTFNPIFSSGSVMDLGIYCIYPFVYLFSNPVSVHAYADLLDSGVDAAGTVILKYPEFHVTITHSKVSTTANNTEIQGELGTIVIENISSFTSVCFIDNEGVTHSLSAEQDSNNLLYIAQHVGELLSSGFIESPINNHALSSDVMAVLDNVRRQTHVRFPADIF